MSKQLKLIPTYKCNIHDNQGNFIRTAWETPNKEYAEDFCKTFKIIDANRKCSIEEITNEEIF